MNGRGVHQLLFGLLEVAFFSSCGYNCGLGRSQFVSFDALSSRFGFGVEIMPLLFDKCTDALFFA